VDTAQSPDSKAAVQDFFYRNSIPNPTLHPHTQAREHIIKRQKGHESKLMHVEGLDKLIFTNVHFAMKVSLEKGEPRESEKAEGFIGWSKRSVRFGRCGKNGFRYLLN